MAVARVRPGVVDDMILFGSPGAGVDDVWEYNLPKGHAWGSGVDGGDDVQGIGTPVGFGPNPLHMTGVTHLSNDAPGDRGFLGNMFHPFARHSVYLTPDSGTLKDFGSVVAGVKQPTVLW